MVLVIIAGNIDLSVGSVSAAVGISVALAMQNWNLPWPLAILFGLALGAIIGRGRACGRRTSASRPSSSPSRAFSPSAA